MAAAITNQRASGMPGVFAWSAGRNWESPISWGSVHSHLGEEPVLRSQMIWANYEAPELLIDIRGWMSHNTLKLMCFID